jgi:hypothetical protein
MPSRAAILALTLALFVAAGAGYVVAGYRGADQLGACQRVASQEPMDGAPMPPPADEDVERCLGAD